MNGIDYDEMVRGLDISLLRNSNSSTRSLAIGFAIGMYIPIIYKENNKNKLSALWDDNLSFHIKEAISANLKPLMTLNIYEILNIAKSVFIARNNYSGGYMSAILNSPNIYPYVPEELKQFYMRTPLEILMGVRAPSQSMEEIYDLANLDERLVFDVVEEKVFEFNRTNPNINAQGYVVREILTNCKNIAKIICNPKSHIEFFNNKEKKETYVTIIFNLFISFGLTTDLDNGINRYATEKGISYGEAATKFIDYKVIKDLYAGGVE